MRKLIFILSALTIAVFFTVHTWRFNHYSHFSLQAESTQTIPEVRFVETPLKSALAELSGLSGVIVDFDPQSSDLANQSSENPVTTDLKNVTPEQAAVEILRQAAGGTLTVREQNHRLVIDTYETLKDLRTELCVYDVADIFAEIETGPVLMAARGSGEERFQFWRFRWQEPGQFITRVAYRPDVEGSDRSWTPTELNEQRLIALNAALNRTDDMFAGLIRGERVDSCRMAGDRLVLVASPGSHSSMERILMQLRHHQMKPLLATDRSIVVDCADGMVRPRF